MKRKQYDTVTDAVNDLTKRGYTSYFMVHPVEDKIACVKTFNELKPEEFKIDEVHRFEGMTDPGDEMIVYAVSSLDNKIKGVIVNGYGIYSSYRASKLVERLDAHISH